MTLRSQDFKSRASASFATPARTTTANGELSLPVRSSKCKAGDGTRTRDPNLGKVVLYQLSYSRSPPNLAAGSYAW